MFNVLIIWGIVLVCAVVAEVVTMQLVTIWFAAGSIGAFIAAAAGASLIVQLVIFVGISLVLLIFTRPILKKLLKFDFKDTNAGLDIGKTAVVIQEIEPEKGLGRARLGDSEWRAVSENGEKIPEGAVVRVLKIDGTKLIVAPQTEKQTIGA